MTLLHPEELREVLEEQNPWQRFGRVPGDMAPPSQRPLAHLLWVRLIDNAPRRHHLIVGPRRVGKTTILYQTVQSLLNESIEPSRIFWLQMDHADLLDEDLGHLVRVCSESCGASPERPAFLMVDEIVRASRWDNWLKTFHDQRWPVRIVATASASAEMRTRHAESGVGRWEEHYLSPYDFSEYCELVSHQHGKSPLSSTLFPTAGSQQLEVGKTLEETLRWIQQGTTPNPDLMQLLSTFTLLGGFPEIIVEEHRREISKSHNEVTSKHEETAVSSEHAALRRAQRVLRSEIIDRVIYKDIQQFAEVRNPQRLERLLYSLAGQVAQLFSVTNLSKKLGISARTVEEYAAHLEQAFLIFMLSNYSGNEASTQKRGRKLFFTDGAVRNAVLQRGIASSRNAEEEGHLLENLVASALRTLSVHAGVRLYYWRDSKTEVDFIFDDPQGPLAFEVGKSSGHSRNGLRALMLAHEKFVNNCYIVSPGSQMEAPSKRTEGIGSIPLDAFLLAVGEQARIELINRVRH